MYLFEPIIFKRILTTCRKILWKVTATTRLDAILWENSLGDATLQGLFCNSSFEYHSFVFKFGTLCGTSRTFTFFTSQLLWLFSHVSLPFCWHWLAHSQLQSYPSSLLSKHSAVFIPSVWLSPFALASVQWIASNLFPSSAGSVVMPTLGFVHCFYHKWWCNFCKTVRNFSEICNKWEIMIPVLASVALAVLIFLAITVSIWLT